jgi:hypothetical protein
VNAIDADGFAGSGPGLGSFTGMDSLLATGGDDTLDLSALTTGLDISVVSPNTVSGFDLAIGGIGGLFEGVEILVGSQGIDTLTGLDAVSAWNYTDTTQTYVSGALSMTYSAVENLIGGSDTDLLSYASQSGPIHIVLTSATLIGFAGTATDIVGTFAGMDQFAGSLSSEDSLTGLDAEAGWQFNAAVHTYTAGGSTADFWDIEDVFGGSAVDTFSFADGGRIVGAVDGGGGVDLLDYSAYLTDVHVDLAAGTADHTGGVSNMENITGGWGNDELTGDGGPNVITGGPGNDTMAGGAGDDTYIFAVDWGADLPIVDTAGTDTLDFSAVNAALNVVLGSLDVSDGLGNSVSHAGSDIEAVRPATPSPLEAARTSTCTADPATIASYSRLAPA